MGFRKFLLGAAVGALFLWPPVVSASAQSQIILSRDRIDPKLQVVDDNPFTVTQTEEGILLNMAPGNFSFIYPLSDLGYRPEKLTIFLKTDSALDVTIIPDITTTAAYTYELQQKISPTGDYAEYSFSLIHPYFKNAANIGIGIVAKKEANITFREIYLSQDSLSARIGQAFKDYFKVAPYSGFTVNLFPAPRIFGHDAFIYLLPIFFLFAGLLLFSKKYRKSALAGFLVLWLLTDGRMAYEFVAYQIEDYKTWIQPAAPDKTLRTYDDFYVFADWVKSNIPPGIKEIKYLDSVNPHFPRLLQYLDFPLRIGGADSQAGVWVVYDRSDLRFNADTGTVMQQEKTVSRPGTLIAQYNDRSFIFVQK
ncbi:hypothetical protein D4R52_02400 [bacterium]|nr:MAG: hypothetical protein D4R52_02400 [bacterium]